MVATQAKRSKSRENTKIRVLAIERMLCEGRRITTTEILHRLDVQYDIQADRRTVTRDIDAIDKFTPIISFPGRYGGYARHDVLGECEKDGK